MMHGVLQVVLHPFTFDCADVPTGVTSVTMARCSSEAPGIGEACPPSVCLKGALFLGGLATRSFGD